MEEMIEVSSAKQTPNRGLILTGVVTDDLASNIIADLLYMQDQDPLAPITLYVCSPGGDAYSMFGIYDIC